MPTTRATAAYRDASTPASSRAWVMLLGVLSMAAAAGLMFVGSSLGMLYAVVAVVGVFAVIVVVVAPVFGIVVFVGTLLLGLPWFLAGDGRLTANNLLGLILLAVLIVQICLTRDLWFLKTTQVVMFALIGAALLISFMNARQVYIPHTPLPKDYTENTLFIFFTRLAFLCMFVNFVRTKRHVLLVLFAVLVFTMAVIPSAFQNLANYKGEEDVATGKTLDADTGKVTEFRITSDTTSWGKNENRLAFMCNVSILLIWLFMQIRRRWWVWALGFPLILVMGGLTLSTASRSGFLSLGVAFLFLLFQKGIGWRLRGSVFAAIAFCGLIFFLVLPRASYERLLNYSTDQSAHGEAWRSTERRIETNQHALEVFQTAPILGVGPGNFRWLHRELYPYSLAAGRPNHNSYLWAATEGGALTLGLYLILFVFLWRDLQRSQPLYRTDDEMWHVVRFLRGFLGIWIFFSAFADFWLDVHLYLIAGLAMLLVRQRFEDYGAEAAPAAADHRAAAGPGAAVPEPAG
jgi:O-antigen ligase